MKKIIRITESDLEHIVKRVIKETNMEKDLAMDYIVSMDSREKEEILNKAKEMDFDLFKEYVLKYKPKNTFKKRRSFNYDDFNDENY